MSSHREPAACVCPSHYGGVVTKRTYEDDSIRVWWDSSLCIHTAHCIRTGDGSFDPSRRPWVDLSAASVDVVAAAIEGCPTGALRYERLDGGPQEEVPYTTSIVPFPNGPLMVRGEIEVRDRHGDVFVAAPRVALCRCGESKNQPFCDLSHRESSFRDHPKAPVPNRDAALNPDDITTETL
jgi:uncharacterized Fe-S cluster protein YjdI/CDGSH-type Zn-finger protein